jgi:hypothetical protein
MMDYTIADLVKAPQGLVYSKTYGRYLSVKHTKTGKDDDDEQIR